MRISMKSRPHNSIFPSRHFSINSFSPPILSGNMQTGKRSRKKTSPADMARFYCEANEDPPGFIKKKINAFTFIAYDKHSWVCNKAFVIPLFNFQSMKSPVELNGLFLKFFCYVTCEQGVADEALRIVISTVTRVSWLVNKVLRHDCYRRTS